jgi:hypothetical protein
MFFLAWLDEIGGTLTSPAQSGGIDRGQTAVMQAVQIHAFLSAQEAARHDGPPPRIAIRLGLS